MLKKKFEPKVRKKKDNNRKPLTTSRGKQEDFQDNIAIKDQYVVK